METIIDFVHQSIFYEFAALLFLVAIIGYISSFLKQPLILAYIAAGVLASPAFLGLVSSDKEIELLAKLGISILLFIVGLKLDLKLVKSLGSLALITGCIQMAFTAALAYLIAVYFGFDSISSFYIAIAMAFSSTIIIVKMLSDKKEIDSLHGRIALGVLIIQDFAVVISMMILATLAASPESGQIDLAFEIFKVFGYGLILIAFLAVFMKFAAEKLVSQMARLPELLLCFSLAWAILLAALCDYIGLSKELGGLLAGISLASTPYREAIIARLGSLRDFLLLFFFVLLGSQLELGVVHKQILPAIALSAFVLLFKPFIIILSTKLMGYKIRTGFMAGISLAQISEFSLIFIAMALSLGFVSQDVMALVTLTGLITIGVSTYILSASHLVYDFFEPFLDKFEQQDEKTVEDEGDSAKASKKYDVILFGMGRYGRAIADDLIKNKYTVLIVDFNPDVIRYCRYRKFDAMYGDASDTDFYSNLPTKHVKWIVSAMPQQRADLLHEDPKFILIESLKQHKYKGGIAVATNESEAVSQLKKMGAHVVFLPFQDAAQRAVNLMKEHKKK